MIVIPGTALEMLMTHIVETTHMLCDENMEPVRIGTIDPKALRMAAICAVQAATGTECWPGDRVLKFKRRPTRQGIFEEVT